MFEDRFLLPMHHGLCLSKDVVFFMVVPIGCHERSSHVSWKGDLHLQKVWKIKLPPREKGILEDFM